MTFFSHIGPQNGWNDPPTLIRASKKKVNDTISCISYINKSTLALRWPIFNILCHHSASPGELHPSCPHHRTHHGSTGSRPSSPAGAFRGPSGHGPGTTGGPGSLFWHAPAAVLPSSRQSSDAQHQRGGCTWSTNWRCHTGRQLIRLICKIKVYCYAIQKPQQDQSHSRPLDASDWRFAA